MVSISHFFCLFLGNGYLPRLIVACIYGNSFDKIIDDTGPKPSSKKDRGLLGECGLIMFCFLGLQVSYLTWGVLQEKVMTKVGFNVYL